MAADQEGNGDNIMCLLLHFNKLLSFFLFICSTTLITGIHGDCNIPPRLTYASLNEQFQGIESFAVGQSVQYTCRVGYVRVQGSSNSLTCLANSTWPETDPFCQLRSCPAPEEIANGRAEADTITFGSKVTYICNEGYRLLSRLNTRECQADGTWSGVLPECEVQICPPPNEITDGTFEPKKEEYEYQNAVTYTCNGRLVLVGKESISCTANGNWSHDAPQCTDVSCSDPIVPNSRKLSGFQGPYSLNSAVRFECNNGYTMNGSDSIRCNINSEWEPSLPKCLLECPAPIILNAMEISGFSGPYLPGSSVTFTCKKGFSLSGNGSVTCNINGQWEPPLPTCLIECPAPIVPNAERLPESTGPYILNSAVTFKCFQNFTIRGSDTVKCNVNGQWEPQLPTCQNPDGGKDNENNGGSSGGAGGAGGNVGAIVVKPLVVAECVDLGKDVRKPMDNDYNAHYKSCSDENAVNK
ncbi:membrane cofactor protein-like [Pelodytes ibericus]